MEQIKIEANEVEKIPNFAEKIDAMLSQSQADFMESDGKTMEARKKSEEAKLAYEMAEANTARLKEEGIALEKIRAFFSIARSDDQKVFDRKELNDIIKGEQTYLESIEALEKKRASFLAKNPIYAEVVANEIKVKKARLLSPEIISLVKEALEKI